LKLPQLTFTRFIAAIAIVFFHDQGHTFPFTNPSINYWVSYSDVFVSYFFVLSGFILVISSVREDKLTIPKRSFWFNRFARIYPLYLFALLMYLGLSLSARTPNTKLSIDQFFFSTTLIQSWIPKHVMVYNYVSWSLSVEAFFYLIFPFLILTIPKYRLSTVALCGVGLWAISLFAFVYFKSNSYSYLFTDYFPLLHVNTFIAGVIAGYFFIEYRQVFINNRKWLLSIFLLFSSVAIILIANRNNFVRVYYHNGLFVPLFLSLILYLSSLEDNSRLKRVLSNKALQYLGEISYGIYILQVAFLILIKGLNSRLFHLPQTAIFYLYVLLLIVFCAICHELIEKNCRKILKGLFSRPQKMGQLDPITNIQEC
jgi:peptidoglycan/LPS O-acetylase OafA/YrhL